MADARKAQSSTGSARNAHLGPYAEVPLEAIRQAVESIRYGAVQIVVQDGRVVQIDKTEKIRLV